MFTKSFREIQVHVHKTARDKGWWDSCLPAGRKNSSELFPKLRNTGEAIALMHSELSEALEYARKGNGLSDHIPQFLGVEEEFADVIIRIMDFAEANNLDVAGAIIAKAKFNQGREKMHGGKKF